MQTTSESAFDRLELIMGTSGLEKLQKSTVMVLGLGGVGSNCVMALARGGVGQLILVDRDVVAPSNINRQAVATTSTIGRAKTEVAREMVLDINPACKVVCLNEFLDKDTIPEQLDNLPRPHYIVDAIDTLCQKIAIAQWAQSNNIPLISSMGGANKLNPFRFAFAPLEKTSGDPLCKIMRKECRRRGITGVTVLYSCEPSMDVARKNAQERSEQHGTRPQKGVTLGTMSYIPPIMGQMIAGKVLCELTGLTNPHDTQSIPARGSSWTN